MRTFERPIGPKADMEELFYISALHQTNLEPGELRTDGSINLQDVQRFLVSRYGVKIESDDLRRVLFDSHTHYETLDLVELVALMFVPQFCKWAATKEELEDLEPVCPLMVDAVLKMILRDATGSCEYRTLTKELVKDILNKYGEKESAKNDELLTDMVDCAIDRSDDGKAMDEGGDILNPSAFVNALTSDVKDTYNVRDELYKASHFYTIMVRPDSLSFESPKIPVKDESEVHDRAEKEEEHHENLEAKYSFVYTAAELDFTAGTYACKYTVMLAWTAFIYVYLGYIYPIIRDLGKIIAPDCTSYDNLVSFEENIDAFNCDILDSIINFYAIFISAIVFGTTFISFLTLGFESDSRLLVVEGHEGNLGEYFRLAIFTLSVCLLLSYLPTECKDSGNVMFCYLQVVGLLCIGICIMIRVLSIAKNCFKILAQIQHPSGYDEAKLKKAAAKRIHSIQKNAMLIHADLDDSLIKTHFGLGLINFAKSTDKTEQIGGLQWGWDLFKNGLETEGIWTSARFVGSVVNQVLGSIFLLLSSLYIAQSLSESWVENESIETQVTDFARDFISTIADAYIVQNAASVTMSLATDFFIQFLALLDNAGLLNFDCFIISSYLASVCSGITSGSTDLLCSIFASPGDNFENTCMNLETLFRPLLLSPKERVAAYNEVFNETVLRDYLVEVTSTAASENVAEQLNYLYPEQRYMISIPAYVGVIISFIASICISIVVLPSLMSVVVRLRCGLLPTMKDEKHFILHRYFVHLGSLLSGVMFWGNIVGASLIGLFFATLLFLSLWQVTSFIMQMIYAMIISALSIIFFRWAFISRPARVNFYKGFYRLRPAAANWYNVVDESLNFIISTFTVISRFLIATALNMLYLGRVDEPFLAEDADRFFDFFVFEPFHRIFITSVLMTEAHKHPYIETLGSMYLLQLKHQEKIFNRAGNTWRLLFVTALMPWLQKYRNLVKEREGSFVIGSKRFESSSVACTK